MSFLVEPGDGTAPLANSYTTVQEFKDYWVDRGFDFSAYTDSQIQVALIRATDYIEQQYRNRFIGYRLLPETQPLSWPRTCAYVNWVALTGLPVNLKRATSEYAKRALPEDAQLLPEPNDTDATGMIVESGTKKVGPIEITTTYASVGALTSKSYPAADKWLSDLVYNTSGVVRN